MIFPVNYNEKFYKYVLKAGELAKLAYYNEMIVGAVCCRVEENSDNKHLYIMTLGCLAQYRRLSMISLPDLFLDLIPPFKLYLILIIVSLPQASAARCSNTF